MSQSIAESLDLSRGISGLKKKTTKYTVYEEEENKLKEETNKKVKGFLDLLVINVDWKILILILFVTLIIFIVILNKIYEYVKITGNYNDYGIQIISFFMFFIVINYVIFILSFSHYIRINQTVNFKGNRGPQGDKGEKGIDVECNICQAKPQLLKRPIKYAYESEIVMPDLNEFTNSEEKKSQVFETPQELGLLDSNLKNKCLNYKCNTVKNKNVAKGLVGLVSNLSEENNIKLIDNIQFLNINDKGLVELLGNENGIWGGTKKNNIQEIQCPKNSVIHKMEALYTPFTEDKSNNSSSTSRGGLLGVSIACRDLVTGEPVELENNYIGEKPVNNSDNFKYDVVYCDGKAYFEEIGCNYDDSGINKLIFYKCKTI